MSRAKFDDGDGWVEGWPSRRTRHLAPVYRTGAGNRRLSLAEGVLELWRGRQLVAHLREPRGLHRHVDKRGCRRTDARTRWQTVRDGRWECRVKPANCLHFISTCVFKRVKIIRREGGKRDEKGSSVSVSTVREPNDGYPDISNYRIRSTPLPLLRLVIFISRLRWL